MVCVCVRRAVCVCVRARARVCVCVCDLNVEDRLNRPLIETERRGDQVNIWKTCTNNHVSLSTILHIYSLKKN